MALTSVSTVKSLLNISASDTTLDNWITAIKPAAEMTIKRYLDRDIESTTYTEFYSGENRAYFVLNQYPVTSITSLHFDDTAWYGKNPIEAFPASTLLTEGTDFVLDYKSASNSQTGLVYKLHGVWTSYRRDYQPRNLSIVYGSSWGNIKVVYVAGYSSIPDDIQLAVAMLVSEEMRSLPKGGSVMSERIGDYSYEMAGERMMGKLQVIGSIRQILSRYREVW